MFEWLTTPVALGIIAFIVIYLYNKLVSLRNRVRNAFAQIDVQLQRRYDLIPNLVESVKGYLTHESEVLEAVTSARQVALNSEKNINADDAAQVSKLMQAENALNGALMNLYAVQENYPDLKADATVMELIEELQHSENRISFARQAYNDSVMVYRNGRESFPANIVANLFNFQDCAMWELADPQAASVPKVKF